ncbi:MAG: hypothetical protein JRG73_00360 [Deltaproteobacteria bacterium]|nr:hypothetical protein [Deltaproteobacteria bacterium]
MQSILKANCGNIIAPPSRKQEWQKFCPDARAEHLRGAFARIARSISGSYW